MPLEDKPLMKWLRAHEVQLYCNSSEKKNVNDDTLAASLKSGSFLKGFHVFDDIKTI